LSYIELQQRGAFHIHGCAQLKGAPEMTDLSKMVHVLSLAGNAHQLLRGSNTGTPLNYMYNPGLNSSPRSVPVALLDKVVICIATIVCLLICRDLMPRDVDDPQVAVTELFIRVPFY
jgi:hypothetical protein